MRSIKGFLLECGALFVRMMHDQGGDVVQMLTPPKDKSVWEAMTVGSTGGWAAPIFDPFGGTRSDLSAEQRADPVLSAKVTDDEAARKAKLRAYRSGVLFTSPTGLDSGSNTSSAKLR